MEWHGVAMVDFKLDAKDGVPELMEVNGRFGQLPLSIAPGVGFPDVGFAYLPGTMATEGDVDPVFGDCARVGCRPVRAILRDLLCHAALRDGGGGSEVIIGFLRSGWMGCDILLWGDLLPVVGVMRVVAHWMGDVLGGMRNVGGKVG